MDRQERDGWTDREPPRAAHSTRGQRVALLDADNFSSWNELWMLPKTGGGAGLGGCQHSSARESAASALSSPSNLQMVQSCFSQFTSAAKWPQIYSPGVRT